MGCKVIRKEKRNQSIIAAYSLTAARKIREESFVSVLF